MQHSSAATTRDFRKREDRIRRPILEEVILSEGPADVLRSEAVPDGLIFQRRSGCSFCSLGRLFSSPRASPSTARPLSWLFRVTSLKIFRKCAVNIKKTIFFSFLSLRATNIHLPLIRHDFALHQWVDVCCRENLNLQCCLSPLRESPEILRLFIIWQWGIGTSINNKEKTSL